MKTKLVATFLVFTFLYSLFSGASLCRTQTGTNVSGIIFMDTIWTKTNSPYSLTGHIAVSSESTLIIEPGAIVNLNNYCITINGTLCATGVNFNQGQICFTKFSASWNKETKTGSIISDSNITGKITITDSSPMILNNSLVDTSCPIIVDGGAPIIAGNHIEPMGFYDALGRDRVTRSGIALDGNNNALITDNTISGLFSGVQVLS